MCDVKKPLEELSTYIIASPNPHCGHTMPQQFIQKCCNETHLDITLLNTWFGGTFKQLQKKSIALLVAIKRIIDVPSNFCTKLTLNKFALSEMEAKILGETLLLNNCNITSLLLESCSISDRTLKQLAESLKYNSSVELLSLEHNKITPNGVEHLIACLEDNTSLEVVKLKGNKLNSRKLKKYSEKNCIVDIKDLPFSQSEEFYGKQAIQKRAKQLVLQNKQDNPNLWPIVKQASPMPITPTTTFASCLLYSKPSTDISSLIQTACTSTSTNSGNTSKQITKDNFVHTIQNLDTNINVLHIIFEFSGNNHLQLFDNLSDEDQIKNLLDLLAKAGKFWELIIITSDHYSILPTKLVEAGICKYAVDACIAIGKQEAFELLTRFHASLTLCNKEQEHVLTTLKKVVMY